MSGRKLFTFLDHDGVPWNNNNAEHAIKLLAKYRRNVDGYCTERTLQKYLVLATVFETCEFNNVNVLKFMLSKETTLDGLLAMAGRKRELVAAKMRGEPLGQIATRELEVQRIAGALHRAEDLTGDVATAIETA